MNNNPASEDEAPKPPQQEDEEARAQESLALSFTPIGKFAFARPPPLQWQDLSTASLPPSPRGGHPHPHRRSNDGNSNHANHHTPGNMIPSPQQSCGSLSPLSCGSVRTEIVTPCASQQLTPDQHSLHPPTPPTPPTPPSIESSPYAARFRQLILREVKARQQFQPPPPQSLPPYAPVPAPLDLNAESKERGDDGATEGDARPPWQHKQSRRRRRHRSCVASLPLDADGETYESLCTTGVTYITEEAAAAAPADPSQPPARKRRRLCTLEESALREEAQTRSQDEDVRLDIVDEVHLCAIVPLLPKSFLETAFVQQLVPCTVLAADACAHDEEGGRAPVQDLHELPCQQHLHQVLQAHLRHVHDCNSSSSSCSAAAEAPQGALVEWSGGKVGYTHDTEGLLAEQRTVFDYSYNMTPHLPGKDGSRIGLVGAAREQLQRLATTRAAWCVNGGDDLGDHHAADGGTLEMPCRCSRCARWTPTTIVLARPPTAPLLAAYLSHLETTATARGAQRPGAATPSLLSDRILNELFMVTLRPRGLKVHQTRQLSLHPAFATMCAAAVAALWREDLARAPRDRRLLLRELERQLPPFMFTLVQQEPDLADALGDTSEERQRGGREETPSRWHEPVQQVLVELEDEFLDFVLSVIKMVAQKRFFMLFEVLSSVSGSHAAAAAAAAVYPSTVNSGGAATAGIEGGAHGTAAGTSVGSGGGGNSGGGGGAHHAEAVVDTLREQLAELTSPAAVLRLLQQSHLLGPALRRRFGGNLDDTASLSRTSPLSGAACKSTTLGADSSSHHRRGHGGCTHDGTSQAEEDEESNSPSPTAQAPGQLQEDDHKDSDPSFLYELHLLDSSFFALFKSWYLHLSAHTRTAPFNWQQQMQQQPLRLVELHQLLQQPPSNDDAASSAATSAPSIANLRQVFSASTYYQWLCADSMHLNILEPATTKGRSRRVCAREPYLDLLLRTAATAQHVFRPRQREVRQQLHSCGAERQMKVLRKLIQETTRKGRSMTSQELQSYVEMKEQH